MAPKEVASERLETPAQVSAALASWVARAEQREGDLGVTAPARLTAELAEWVASQDPQRLRKAFRRTELELFEQRPDHHYVHEYYGHSAHKLHSGLDDEDFFPLAREVWDQGRTYLYYNRLYTLHNAVRSLARRFRSGEVRFLEVGVFRGGSAYFLARTAERYLGGRTALTAVDTFEGHSEQDLPTGNEGPHTPGSFAGTSVDDVRAYLTPFPFAEVVQGRIQDVAPDLPTDLHLIHIDVDIYEATRASLEIADQRLVAGGIAIVDDYGFITCPGAKRAVDEFAEEHGPAFIVHPLDSGQALMVRTS